MSNSQESNSGDTPFNLSKVLQNVGVSMSNIHGRAQLPHEKKPSSSTKQQSVSGNDKESTNGKHTPKNATLKRTKSKSKDAKVKVFRYHAYQPHGPRRASFVSIDGETGNENPKEKVKKGTGKTSTSKAASRQNSIANNNNIDTTSENNHDTTTSNDLSPNSSSKNTTTTTVFEGTDSNILSSEDELIRANLMNNAGCTDNTESNDLAEKWLRMSEKERRNYITANGLVQGKSLVVNGLKPALHPSKTRTNSSNGTSSKGSSSAAMPDIKNLALRNKLQFMAENKKKAPMTDREVLDSELKNHLDSSDLTLTKDEKYQLQQICNINNKNFTQFDTHMNGSSFSLDSVAFEQLSDNSSPNVDHDDSQYLDAQAIESLDNSLSTFPIEDKHHSMHDLDSTTTDTNTKPSKMTSDVKEDMLDSSDLFLDVEVINGSSIDDFFSAVYSEVIGCDF
eukprot:Nk52_evm31s1671 gene=Nk52_evmTU31s1671